MLRGNSRHTVFSLVSLISLVAVMLAAMPAVMPPAAAAGPDAAAVVTIQPAPMTMRLTPSVHYLAGANRLFVAAIRLDPQQQPFDTVAAHLQFDPTKLRVVDEFGAAAMEIIPGTALPTVTQNVVDPVAGVISFVASVPVAQAPTQEFTVALIRFVAVENAIAGTSVNFLATAPQLSGVTLEGANQPLVLQGAFYRIAQTAIRLPLLLRMA